MPDQGYHAFRSELTTSCTCAQIRIATQNHKSCVSFFSLSDLSTARKEHDGRESMDLGE